MGNSSKGEFDFTDFNAMLSKLAGLAKAGYIKEVIRNEIGEVCKKSSNQVKSATAGNITRRYMLKGSVAELKEIEKKNRNHWAPKTPFPTQSPHLVGRIKFEGNSKFRIPQDVTSKNITRVKKYLAKRRKDLTKRVGLAKSTFIHVNEKAGKKGIKFQAKAIKAKQNYPQISKHIKAGIKGHGWMTTAEFDINSEALTLGCGGRLIVGNNIKGRIKYFETNYKKKLFKDLEKAAEKYGFKFKGS